MLVLDLKGGISGDGKQETRKQNTPCDQSARCPGAPPAKQTVPSLH